MTTATRDVGGERKRGRRDHLVLVPGCGAFEALGAIEYFAGVIPPLHEVAPFSIHVVPGAPAARVTDRAAALAAFLARRMYQGTIRGGDAVHLVAHSTGGLAVRQMLHLLRDPAAIVGRRHPVPGGLILGAIRSVQYLSVPHRGTNVAAQLAGLRLPLRLAALAAYELLCAGGPALAAEVGRRARALMPELDHRNLLAAAVDTLAGASSDGLAPERASLEGLRAWLGGLARGGAALDDLRPIGAGAGPTPDTPARWPEALVEHELAFYERIGGRVRSIVTVARADDDAGLDVLPVLLWLAARAPAATLGREEPVALLLDGGRLEELQLGSSDALVSSVSMVWPDAARSRVVRADHGDIIGHYAWFAIDDEYDLLRSRPAFGADLFGAVWREVGRFALRGWDDRPVQRLEPGAPKERTQPSAAPAASTAE